MRGHGLTLSGSDNDWQARVNRKPLHGLCGARFEHRNFTGSGLLVLQDSHAGNGTWQITHTCSRTFASFLQWSDDPLP